MKPGTELMPVFVDESGRRRRGVRRIAYALGAAVLLALLVLWLSQLGGTVTPQQQCPAEKASAAEDCRR